LERGERERTHGEEKRKRNIRVMGNMWEKKQGKKREKKKIKV